MKVYIVGKNDSIEKVFSSEEKANEHLANMQLLKEPLGSYRVYYWVREFEVEN